MEHGTNAGGQATPHQPSVSAPDHLDLRPKVPLAFRSRHFWMVGGLGIGLSGVGTSLIRALAQSFRRMPFWR
jgi:hypothetical protein